MKVEPLRATPRIPLKLIIGLMAPLSMTACPTPGHAQSTVPKPQFAYVANGISDNILAYRINADTGALTPVTGSPFAIGGRYIPGPVTINPAGTFAYVEAERSVDSNGRILAYRINVATGALTPVAGSPFTVGGIFPSIVTINPAGTFAYVKVGLGIDRNDRISAYRINATTGALTPVTGSPFAIGGRYTPGPGPVTINPAGTFAYVTSGGVDSKGRISAYRINATTGALTPVTGSPFAVEGDFLPRPITINPDGTFAYMTSGGFNSKGRISAYRINAATGALTPVAGSPFAAGVSPFSIVLAQP